MRWGSHPGKLKLRLRPRSVLENVRVLSKLIGKFKKTGTAWSNGCLYPFELRSASLL